MSRKITAVLFTATVATGLLFSLAFAVGCGATEEAVEEPAGETETTVVEEEPALEGAVYTCPMHPEVTSDEPGECPKCGMDLVIKEGPVEGVVYTCPMHSDVTSDKPGECPECGMDLVMKEGTVEGVVYTCPHDPNVTSDKPGDCPKCGPGCEMVPKGELPEGT